MRVLVTGASGFIGSHVCERLVERGDYVVGIGLRGFDRTLKDDRFRYVIGDVTNSWSIQLALDRFPEPCEAVIHLAGQLLREESNSTDFIKVNALGLQRVIDECVSRGTKRFVFASSASVYDVDGKLPYKERSCESPCERPGTTYAASKRSGELIGAAAVSLGEIDFTSLRMFTVYGPRQREHLSVAKFTKLIAAGEPVPLFGSGSRDYIHVDDVVDAIVSVLDLPIQPAFRVYNVGTGVSTSLDDLVHLISKAVGKPAEIIREERHLGNAINTQAYIYKAKTDLAFEAKIGIEEGIRRYVDWWNSQIKR